jgi:hypothetical protein
MVQTDVSRFQASVIADTNSIAFKAAYLLFCRYVFSVFCDQIIFEVASALTLTSVSFVSALLISWFAALMYSKTVRKKIFTKYGASNISEIDHTFDFYLRLNQSMSLLRKDEEEIMQVLNSLAPYQMPS